jgi:hypothetical protein
MAIRKSWRKPIAAGLVLASGLVGLAACSSNADTASRNVSTKAENFEVQRKIVGINDRTDEYVFYVEGRCSIETAEAEIKNTIEVMCRHGENDYRRHNLGPSANTIWIATQLEPIDVSVYHTEVVLKPEGLVPDIKLQGGLQ